jgi:hypothetical protein
VYPPRGRIARADPARPALGRRRGPPPGSAHPGRRDRARQGCGCGAGDGRRRSRAKTENGFHVIYAHPARLRFDLSDGLWQDRREMGGEFIPLCQLEGRDLGWPWLRAGVVLSKLVARRNRVIGLRKEPPPGEAMDPKGLLPLAKEKPETVIAWHRRGFRMFWTWKSHRAPRGSARLIAFPGASASVAGHRRTTCECGLLPARPQRAQKRSSKRRSTTISDSEYVEIPTS